MREYKHLPAIQREACQWLELHDINPDLVPRRAGAVEIKDSVIEAEQIWRSKSGRRELTSDYELRMDKPVKRKIIEEPKDEVIAWLLNP